MGYRCTVCGRALNTAGNCPATNCRINTGASNREPMVVDMGNRCMTPNVCRELEIEIQRLETENNLFKKFVRNDHITIDEITEIAHICGVDVNFSLDHKKEVKPLQDEGKEE